MRGLGGSWSVCCGIAAWCVALCSLSGGCVFDRRGVAPPEPPETCGNGVWDADEACDGAELGGQTCETQGYLGGGTLACAASCTFDVSGCLELEDCGDGVAESPEQCDGADLSGQTCVTLGFDSGQLACTPLCSFDTQGCEGSFCGDGVMDPGEACDLSDFGGETCVSLLHGGGALQCTSTCTIDESACLDVVQGWFDAHWRYRKLITLHASQVVQDESDFPVAIYLPNDADLLAHTQPTGDDLLFTDDGGTQLDHEIEVYDDGSGSLMAWVRIPLLSSSTNTLLYLYYGNPTAGNQENTNGVWDAQFTGVYHLVGNGTVPFEDSSGSGNDAAPGGFAADLTVPGVLGPGQGLNGTDQYIEIPAAATSGRDSFTYCLSVSTSENGSSGTYWHRPSLFGQSTSGYDTGDFGITTNSGELGMWGGLAGNLDDDTLSSEVINEQAWRRVCAIGDGNEVRLFLDDMGSVATIPAGNDVNGQAFWLGGRAGEGGGGDFHQGLYDELRISSGARTPAWVTTSYRSLHLPGSFMQADPQQYYLE